MTTVFEQQWIAMDRVMAPWRSAGDLREIPYDPGVDWPPGGNRNLVLSQDTAVELGNPRDVSTSFLLWDEDHDDDKAHTIFLNGPDLPERGGSMLPFGKVVLIRGRGFTSENTYDRCRELEGVRYALDLKGYMLRAVSQYQREWSRISYDALDRGFSFQVLGSALIDAYRKLDYVDSVSIVFVTESIPAVKALSEIGDQAGRIVGAMNKMIEEHALDCKSCDYEDVCRDVAALRAMRKTMNQKEVAHETQ